MKTLLIYSYTAFEPIIKSHFSSASLNSSLRYPVKFNLSLTEFSFYEWEFKPSRAATLISKNCSASQEFAFVAKYN